MMKRWANEADPAGSWTEEFNAEETALAVQPLIDRMFDPQKLAYITADAEPGLVRQSDWIGAVIPGGLEDWDDIQRTPRRAHITDIDYGACLMAAIQARKTEWMYTVLPSAWGLEHPWREPMLGTNTADRAWRWPPQRAFMASPYISGPYGHEAYGMSEAVVFDSSGQWFCVEDTDRACYLCGAQDFMAELFSLCPGGETGLRWRAVDYLHWGKHMSNSDARLHRPGFEAFHIRRIEPRPGACPRERMATLWPFEEATIPLGSPWDGPTPDDLSEDDARRVAERWGPDDTV